MSKSIFKNTIFKFLLNIFNIIVPIIISPYVLRVLGPDLMGTINFSQTIFAYFFIFAGFGVYQYGLREISRVRDDKEKLSSVFTSLFIFTLITNIITTVSYIWFINVDYSGTELYKTCMILTFNLISNIFYVEWVNEALENYDFITIKTIVIRLIYVVLLFIMVRTAKDFESYLILLVLSTFLNNIVSYVYIRRTIKFNFKDIKILRHIKPMFLVVILSNANVLYTQLDRMMLGEFIGTLSVAYYSTAQNIGNMINALMLTVIHVTIPRLSNYIAKSSKEAYKDLLNKISKIYFLFLFPAAIGILLLSKEIVLLYGGSEYINAIPILSGFAIYLITLGYEAILSNQVMYITGKEREQVGIIFICGAINFIFNIILLKLKIFNGVMAIATTTMANGLVVILEYFYIKYKLKIDFNIFSLDKSKYFFISLIFIPITFIIKKVFNNIVEVSLITMIVNSIVYFVILFIIKDETFMKLFSLATNKIRRK